MNPITPSDDSFAETLQRRLGTRADSPHELDAERSAAARAAARVADRATAEGLADVSYASVDSPFGTLLAVATQQGLVRLAFPEEGVDPVLERLSQRLSPRIVESSRPLDPLRRELDDYFKGARRSFDLALDWSLIGPFARRVLGVTSEIPYGNVLTYTEVAAEAGSPRGSRAAGNALGSNPIPIVIPCHRVLRSGGGLGGYAGGLERKRWLLDLETGTGVLVIQPPI
ncbi:MAG TPA: methylated-DNA--[protein]-cysteine S-methyltransferase [Solirubrobacteraceae bacterium]|jgi:methylated-DNA-[protein]-cysteine S-methyltransferase|nr:methylated-DNA--[protein]-cysteine S-methyltransferase [Solirubrobacteraceae bacterium]